MPPKESLFSTLRKTVVFFGLTRTYLRDAAGRKSRIPSTRPSWRDRASRIKKNIFPRPRRLDGVSRGGRPNYGAYVIWTRQGTFAATPSRPKAVRLIAAVGDYVVSAEPRPKI